MTKTNIRNAFVELDKITPQGSQTEMYVPGHGILIFSHDLNIIISKKEELDKQFNEEYKERGNNA